MYLRRISTHMHFPFFNKSPYTEQWQYNCMGEPCSNVDWNLIKLYNKELASCWDATHPSGMAVLKW